jgi:pyruvate,water dikinase
VPPGFATTAQAYWDLLAANHLTEPIEATLAKFKAGKITLATAGKTIRQSFERAEFPLALANAITSSASATRSAAQAERT